LTRWGNLAHGLWFYRDIGFSRHGHLPQTIGDRTKLFSAFENVFS
jgi:hypothetical protein